MVQDDVRTLCGVARSNGAKVFPCKFVACFAIALGKLSTSLLDYITANDLKLAIASVYEMIKNDCATCGTRANVHTDFLQPQRYDSLKSLGAGTIDETLSNE